MSVTDVPAALRAFLEVQTARAQLYSRFQYGFKAFLQTKQEGVYSSLMAELTGAFSGCSRQVIAIEAALKDLGRADLAALLRQVQEAERDKLRLTLTLQALKQAAAFKTLSWQRQQPGGGGEEVDDDEALALLDPQFAAERARGCHGHACGRGAHGATHACGHAHGHSHGQEQEQGLEQAGAHCSACEQGGERDAADPHGADGRSGAGGADGGASHASGCRPAGMDGTGAAAGALEGGSSGSAGGQAGGPGPEQECGGDGSAQQQCGACGCGHGGGGGGGPAEPSRHEYEAAVKEATQELDACICRINEVIGDLRMELEDA